MNKTATCVLLCLSCLALLTSCDSSGGKSTPDAGDDAGDSGTDEDCTDEDTFDLSQCPDSYPEWDCRVYVDGDAQASGDGWSWAAAVKTPQEGIDLAHCGAVEHGVCDIWEIWVKQGTYYVYEDCRYDTVRLREHVGMYGGFDGTESALDERNWVDNVTTLDGRGGPDGEEHSYHVIWGADDSVLDGFTVTGGRADFPENTVHA
jgi:hypothetical protein